MPLVPEEECHRGRGRRIERDSGASRAVDYENHYAAAGGGGKLSLHIYFASALF